LRGVNTYNTKQPLKSCSRAEGVAQCTALASHAQSPGFKPHPDKNKKKEKKRKE
jgi:hypothetical protein